MSDYIAFMRAMNVPGHGRVTMSDVRAAFAAAGCWRINTFIQSGNIIFESRPKDVKAVLRAVKRTLGAVLNEEPVILLRTVGEVDARVILEKALVNRAELYTSKPAKVDESQLLRFWLLHSG